MARVPPLHIITDDAVLAQPGFPERADGVLRAGGARLALHLRGHATGGRIMYELAAALQPVAHASGAMVLVNDRLDVVLASGVAGAQLGARSIPVADARRLLGTGRLLGASVHSRREAMEAVGGGVEFLLVGTLFASASHPGRSGIGLEIIGDLCDLGIPLIGIGGVSAGRAAAVRGAGAVGVAALSGIWAAREPAEAVSVYLWEMRGFDE